MPITSTNTPSLLSQLPPTMASHSSPAIFSRTRAAKGGFADSVVGVAGMAGVSNGAGALAVTDSSSATTVRHSQIAGGGGRRLPQNEQRLGASRVGGAAGS